MSMTIGRCSITEDPDAGTLRQRGDVVSFSSTIVGGSVDEMQARVQQLRGLMDNDDETVFPFTWSEDASFDGFYTDIAVEVADYAAMLETGACPFSIVMRRVGGFGQPRIEMTVSRTLRTNSHGVTVPVTVPVVVPQGVETDFNATFGSAFTATGSWSAENVASTFTPWEYGWTAGTKFFRFSRAVADHYDGTCKVEIDYDGTYYEAHGVQVPTDAANRWRLSNGLTRVYPEYSTTRSNNQLVVETWNGTTWAGTAFAPINGAVSATSYLAVLGSGTGSGLTSYANCRVIRNDPACCVVRMDFGLYSTTISITYGQPFVVVSQIINYDTPTEKLGWRAIAPGSPASGTLTGGIKATADDSNGRKFLLVNAAACTASAPSLWLTTAATSATWQMCAAWDDFELSGGTGTSMRDYFLGDTAIDMRVVAR